MVETKFKTKQFPNFFKHFFLFFAHIFSKASLQKFISQMDNVLGVSESTYVVKKVSFLAATAAQEAHLSARPSVRPSARNQVNFWQLLASFGNCWQLLATVGTFWHLLAPFCNFWQLLAIFGKCWQLLATVGKC